MLYYSTCSFGSKRHAWGARARVTHRTIARVSAASNLKLLLLSYNLFRSFTEKSFPIPCSFPFFQKLVPPYQKHVPWWRLLKLFCVADILVYLYVVLSFSFGVMSLSSAIFIVIGNVFLTSTPWLLQTHISHTTHTRDSLWVLLHWPRNNDPKENPQSTQHLIVMAPAPEPSLSNLFNTAPAPEPMLNAYLYTLYTLSSLSRSHINLLHHDKHAAVLTTASIVDGPSVALTLCCYHCWWTCPSGMGGKAFAVE